MKARYPWIEVHADQNVVGVLAMEAYVDLSRAIVTRNVRCFRSGGREPELDAASRNDDTFIANTPSRRLSSRATR